MRSLKNEWLENMMKNEYAPVGNDFFAKVNEKLQLLNDEELEKGPDFFIEKNPLLKEEVERYLAGATSRDGRWENLLREWNLWEDEEYDLSYMYTRTIELAKAYNNKQPGYHETGFGSITVDNEYTVMMRLRWLWENLFFGIYPELEPYLNYHTFRKEVVSGNVIGAINWQKTTNIYY